MWRGASGLAFFVAGCCFGSSAPESTSAAPSVAPMPSPAPPTEVPTCTGARCAILEAEAVVADGVTAYFATRTHVLALDDDATTPRVVTEIRTFHVSGMTLSPTHVYWAEQGFGTRGAIRRAPREGGPAETVTALASYATQLAADDHGLCWIAEAQLVCAAEDGTGTRVVQAVASTFAIDPGETLYVHDQTTLRALPRDGGAPRFVVPLAPENGTPMSMLVHDGALYVGENRSRIFGGIARRTADGARTELAEGQWWPTALVVLGDRVLGTAPHVGLVAVPRGGGEPRVVVPHGSYEVHVQAALTSRSLWVIEGDPPHAYRFERASLEALEGEPAPR